MKVKNWDKFQQDDNIKSCFKHEITKMKSTIKYLRKKIDEEVDE